MGTLNSWDVVDGNNNAAPPDGWPENTMNYSDVNNTGRAVQGTLKRFFADINGSLDAGGAADAYTLTLNESGYTAYFDGMMFACSIPATNLTTTPTLNVNGIGAATIVDRNGNAISVGELMSGGIYEFRHDGTNLRMIGSEGVAGATTQFQYNNGGGFAGASGLTYNSGNDQITVANPANFSTDVVFTEQADHSSTIAAGRGYLWVRDDTPSVLVFTNDAGNDTILGVAGSGAPGGADTEIQFNNSGAFDGDAGFTFDVTTGRVFIDEPIVSAFGLQIQSTLSNRTENLVGIFQLGTTGGGDALEIDHRAATGYAIRASGVNSSQGVIRASAGGTGPGFEGINASGSNGLVAQFSNLIAGRTDPLCEILQTSGSTSGLPPMFRLEASARGAHIELAGAVGGDGGGIEFLQSNTSSNVNALDAYEEGTFTAAFTASTGTITISGALSTMSYTRIGRMVNIQGQLQVSSVSSPTGAWRLTGLPFTIDDITGGGAPEGPGVLAFEGLANPVDHTYIVPLVGSTQIQFYSTDGATVNVSLAPEAQASAIVRINYTYYTDT